MFTAGKPASTITARSGADGRPLPDGRGSDRGCGRRILVVRLGAMGDIIHTLPAVAWLKQCHPGSHLTWLVEPRWAPPLEENPYVDRVVPLRRESIAGLFETRRELRAAYFDLAVDFQGLLKSALSARAARPDRLYGFHQSQVRERLAALFYSHQTLSRAAHVVDRNLELATACGGSGIGPAQRVFPLPPGRAEGDLPPGDFVLASPLAGWGSKQWPMDHYRLLGARLRHELGIPLVLDGPPGADFSAGASALPHYASLPGLIYATRRAAAIVGVDSGPLHLAAALGRPGVAIFGPTDPVRNGPYGDTLRVLRTGAAATTYKRGAAIDPSMRNISPDEVFEVLRAVIGTRRRPAGSLAE